MPEPRPSVPASAPGPGSPPAPYKEHEQESEGGGSTVRRCAGSPAAYNQPLAGLSNGPQRPHQKTWAISLQWACPPRPACCHQQVNMCPRAPTPQGLAPYQPPPTLRRRYSSSVFAAAHSSEGDCPLSPAIKSSPASSAGSCPVGEALAAAHSWTANGMRAKRR